MPPLVTIHPTGKKGAILTGEELAGGAETAFSIWKVRRKRAWGLTNPGIAPWQAKLAARMGDRYRMVSDQAPRLDEIGSL